MTKATRKHTPGPWTLTHKAGSNFAVQTFDIRGMMGDSPNVYPIFNRSTAAIDGALIHASPANARLIAAAPELLEALEECSKRLRNAAISGGTDEEYADAAVAEYTALLARIDAELKEAK